MNTNNSNVLRLPLPANVAQQWQLLQRAVAVTQPSTTIMTQAAIHQSGNGGVTVQVLSGQSAAVSRPRTPTAAVL